MLIEMMQTSKADFSFIFKEPKGTRIEERMTCKLSCWSDYLKKLQYGEKVIHP